jgi:hypothetical protein
MPEVLVFPLLILEGIVNPLSMPDICTLKADSQFISTIAYALPLLQRPDPLCVVR